MGALGGHKAVGSLTGAAGGAAAGAAGGPVGIAAGAAIGGVLGFLSASDTPDPLAPPPLPPPPPDALDELSKRADLAKQQRLFASGAGTFLSGPLGDKSGTVAAPGGK